MPYDFWNNPLVVSAFRVKYRRGSLYFALMLYVSFLSCACVAAWYGLPYLQGKAGQSMADADKLHWIFAGLLGFQLAMSAFFCMIMTASAMTLEVNDGTLEYQRLTLLTPARILVGKLLGAPATIYMMTIASIPFTFGIWALGVPGISLATLLLLYVNLAASTLLGGSFGLISPLRKKEQGQMSQAGVGVALSLGGTWFLMIQFAVMGGMTGILMGRGLSALTGLFLPLGPLAGLIQHSDPWFYSLSFFNVRIPFLVATPVAQLTLAALCFVHMSRRLTSTVNPALGKLTAYGLLAGFDVLIAGLLFDPIPSTPDLLLPSTRFWLCHFLVGCFLTLCVTPDYDLLMSWIWRWRGRHAWPRDLWVRDRSENVLALLTFCALGTAIWALLVMMPIILAEGWPHAQPTFAAACDVAIVAFALTMTLGTMYQCCLFRLGFGGASLLAILVLLDLFAFIAPQHLPLPWLTHFSVVADWVGWRRGEPIWVEPLLAWLGCLFLASWAFLRFAMKWEIAEVGRKLIEMGARDGKSAASGRSP